MSTDTQNSTPVSAELVALPQCPFPCGWSGLHKIAVQDAAYLAKVQWPEDEEGVSVQRATAMRSMDSLIQVCRTMLNAAPVAAQAQLGEDIIVNCPDNVYTLPLQSSGLTQGPRFVVHVPAQTSASAELECSHCGGTGDVSGEYPGVACPACGGTGKAAPVAAQATTRPTVTLGMIARAEDVLNRAQGASFHRHVKDALEAALDVAQKDGQFSAQAQQPVSGADGLPIELRGIAEAIGNGGGLWRSCSGCHESNEGMATGPFSETLKCHLGVGCSECGGIGAIWDTTDYDAMADFMAAEYQQRTENTEPVGQGQL
ncbi:hypothetical protein NUK37_20915, partial [Alcaligenes faecalis]|nr:hypothetical protein [Alcaligenes faecalis]